jgi:hypothetical protein
MKPLRIAETSDTPEVNFDKDRGSFRVLWQIDARKSQRILPTDNRRN